MKPGCPSANLVVHLQVPLPEMQLATLGTQSCGWHTELRVAETSPELRAASLDASLADALKGLQLGLTEGQPGIVNIIWKEIGGRKRERGEGKTPT